MTAHIETGPPCPHAIASQTDRSSIKSLLAPGIGQVVALVSAVARHHRNARALDEMPDYLLSDIGLNRGEASELLRRG